jgi:hypothetical protein
MQTQLLALRSELLVAVILLVHPPHLWAQSSVGSIQPNNVLSSEPEYQVEPLGWAVPVRFESGAPEEAGTPPPVLALVRPSGALTKRTSRLARTPAASWLRQAASGDLPHLKLSTGSADSVWPGVQQPTQRERSWIGRHSVLFGTLVGFGGGFLIGYLGDRPGDDSLFFNEVPAGFNGLVIGGVGAGTGALVGAIVGAATK